jgi:hypothetical protein
MNGLAGVTGAGGFTRVIIIFLSLKRFYRTKLCTDLPLSRQCNVSIRVQ